MKQTIKQAKARSVMNKFFCFIMVGATIVSFESCSKKGSDSTPAGTVPNSVIPTAIRQAVGDEMPLYSGTTPPDISGQYLLNNPVLVSTNDPDDVDAPDGAIAIAFINQSGKFTYYENFQDEDDQPDNAIVESVVGSGNNFTAYFTVTTSTFSGISYTVSYVMSGTKTSGGLQNYYDATILLRKGSDPDGELLPVNTYAIYKESDGMASNYSWFTGASSNVPQSSSGVFRKMEVFGNHAHFIQKKN